MRNYLLIFMILMLPIMCSAAPSEQTMPYDSLSSLQEIFTTINDKLWEASEDYWHKGEYDRCIAVMQLITEINPYDVQAYDDGAWLMENELRDDEAEAFLLKGIKNNRESSELYFSLGRFYYFRERFNEAIGYFEVAVSFDVSDIMWHSLAHAYEHAGLTTDALEIWLQREAIDPEDAVPFNQINRIIQGNPAPDTPGFINRAREERRKEEKR